MGSVSNGSGLPGCGTGLEPGCYPEYRGTHQVLGQVRTGPQVHFTVPTTLAPIKIWSSHCMVT